MATVFPPDRLPFAIGIWAALGGVGSAVGPLVAGLISRAASWRVFFGINVVILGVALAILVVLTPRSAPDRREPIPIGRHLALAAGLVAAFAALQNAGDDGWLDPWVIAPLVVGAIVVIAALRASNEPLVAPTISRAPTFRLGTAEATLSNWGSGVLMVLVPTALQVDRGLSVLGAGLVFIAFSAPFAVGGALSGPLTTRRGGPSTLALGSALLMGGLVALGITGITVPLGGLVAILAVAGFGNGIVYSASTSYGLADIGEDRAAEASALLNMLRVLGLSVAVALSNSLVRIVDQHASGTGDNGLRAALLVAAVIVAVGVPIARPQRAALSRR